MPKIMFMRHAKTTLNKEGKFAGRTDCDTTPEGLQKAREDFQYKLEDFDYFYCSPLKRTQQTLKAVIPEAEPIIDERVIERYLGDWEDMLQSSLGEEIIEAYVKGLYNPPNSETYESVRKRVCEFVEEMFEKYGPEDRILVVSHAGVVRQVRDNFLPNIEKGKIKNSALFTVTQEDFDKYLKNKEKQQEDAR